MSAPASCARLPPQASGARLKNAGTLDRTEDLQIVGLTPPQLSYRGGWGYQQGRVVTTISDYSVGGVRAGALAVMVSRVAGAAPRSEHLGADRRARPPCTISVRSAPRASLVRLHVPTRGADLSWREAPAGTSPKDAPRARPEPAHNFSAST